MKKLFSALKYTKNYKGYTALNIIFNILFAITSALVLVLVAPFLDLIFKFESAEVYELVIKGEPKFQLSGNYIKEITNFSLATLILLKGKITAVALVCGLVFIITVLKNLFRYLAMFFIAPIRIGVVRDLRNKLIKKSVELPLSYYSEEKKGDLMGRITSDVQEIEWSIMQTLEMIFREPLTVIILFSFMLAISVKLTLYIICLLPVAAICIVFIGKKLKNVNIKSKSTYGNLSSLIEETLGSLKIIKAFNAQKYTQKNFETTNQLFYRQSLKGQRLVDMSSPVTEIIVTGILMLIMYLGAQIVIVDNEISGSSFITYFALASQLIPPLKQLTQSYNNIQKGIVSEERINKILLADNVIHEIENPKQLSSAIECIEYKNVSFYYNQTKQILNNISITINKGKTIALVGQSGSGKSTLADLLPRFYDVTSGEILLNNITIKQLSLQSLRNKMAVVTQESILFNDTVYNNIVYGLENVTKQDVINAAKIANANEFIEKLQNGYDTNIGDRGNKLSGGQKQRISIARAILRNPEILILDEATSALDTESEKLVQEALTNLMKNRTSIVIAHRLSTIANADEIIVLQQGEVIERGNHTQLYNQNGTYKKLCDMQSFK